MQYTVKQPILGFEDVKEVSIENKDGITCLLKSINENTYMQIALIHANSDINFDVLPDIQNLLDLKDDSNCSIYFPVIIDKNIENSVINLNAPFLFNEDNMTVAQCILNEEV